MPIDAQKAAISDEMWQRLEAVESTIAKSKAQYLTVAKAREEVRAFVKFYFGEVRAIWISFNIDQFEVEACDSYCQELLQLANGKNRRRSYIKWLRYIKAMRPKIDTVLASFVPAVTPSATDYFSTVESKIFETLSSLLPTAALSYKQVLLDLRTDRASYRGTAAELREALREILDHLAPDSEVTAQPNFKLESGLTRPTMKQKASFVLKARGSQANAMNASKDSVELTEALSARVARSVYEKGSIATHLAASKDEVTRVKQYTDAVFVELLEISLS